MYTRTHTNTCMYVHNADIGRDCFEKRRATQREGKTVMAAKVVSACVITKIHVYTYPTH
jgi:hypothetical protein